jgi:hypothetical protein
MFINIGTGSNSSDLQSHGVVYTITVTKPSKCVDGVVTTLIGTKCVTKLQGKYVGIVKDQFVVGMALVESVDEFLERDWSKSQTHGYTRKKLLKYSFDNVKNVYRKLYRYNISKAQSFSTHLPISESRTVQSIQCTNIDLT